MISNVCRAEAIKEGWGTVKRERTDVTISSRKDKTFTLGGEGTGCACGWGKNKERAVTKKP